MADDRTHDTRRSFLAKASAAAAALAAHHQASVGEGAAASPSSSPARIRSLRLLTATPLAEMRAFYATTLGLPILAEREGELTIAGGATPITFVATSGDGPPPFYHFAFNIPENKLRSARTWQRARTPLLPIFPESRDPAYPDDVIHFRSWNSHSIFFLDPAGNVLEYIARHDLDNAAEGPFTERDILHASEIGLTVDDVPAAATGLRKAFGLAQYRPGSDVFSAIGDEHGLLIIFGRGRNLTLGHQPPRHADVFATEVTVRGEGATHYEIPGYPYRLTSG